MKNPFDVHVGEKIRQRRLESKLSAEELGAMLGVSTSELRALEAGVARADAELMRQVVYVLGAPASYYFKGLETVLRAAA